MTSTGPPMLSVYSGGRTDQAQQDGTADVRSPVSTPVISNRRLATAREAERAGDYGTAHDLVKQGRLVLDEARRQLLWRCCARLYHGPVMTRLFETPGVMARMVKRYANRRLYDPGAGRYVTVEQVRALAADTEVLVIEADTGEDITRSLLALH